MKRTTLLIFVLSTLFLSGCVDMKVFVKVEPDGSGRWEVGFHIDPALLGFAQQNQENPQENSGDPFEEIRNVEPQTDPETGITFDAEERISGGDQWIYLTADVPNADAWSQLEVAVSRVNLMGDSSDVDSVTSETDFVFFPQVTVSSSALSKSYRVEFESFVPADTMATDEADTSSDSSFDLGFEAADMISLNYEIAMPGTLGNHNGTLDTVTNNPSWIVNFRSTDPLLIEAESSASNSTMLIGGIVIALVLVLGIAAFVVSRRRSIAATAS